MANKSGTPHVSVVIPVYNQAAYLGEAIHAVLAQTFEDFEIVVVDDASPDNPGPVIDQFHDPRIRFLSHSENRGVSAARNTGIRASSGDLIVLLDADDYFHPEKLEAHVGFHSDHQDIGVSYNSRFELNHSFRTIRELRRPSTTLALSDFVLGFPFAPSDMVLKRDWIFRVDLFDEGCIYGGEDIDLPCRLALEGCRFAGIDRALNYRRYHSGRSRTNLKKRLDEYRQVLISTFGNSRCPAEVMALRNDAFKNRYLEVGIYALLQGETALAQTTFLEAIKLVPSLLEGEPCPLLDFLVTNCIDDDSDDPEYLLGSVFSQLPSEIAWLSNKYDWAVSHAYLLKGSRAVMWGRTEAGRAYLLKAGELGGKIETPLLQRIVHQLLDIEAVLSQDDAQRALDELLPCLEMIGAQNAVQEIKGLRAFNRAFNKYQSEDYSKVPREVLRVLASRPSLLNNRGIIAILVRSLARQVSGRKLRQPT